MASFAIRIWDLPVRLVHWSFVVLVGAMWWTAETGRLKIHLTLGIVTLGLVIFRLLWGLFGSDTARFSAFVKGPAAIRAYLAGLRNGTAAPMIGHNPLGALSVIALLGALGVQVALGLFAQDTDALFSGPLNSLPFVTWELGGVLTELHEAFFNVLLALVALHIAAIAYYRIAKRDNLIKPMITGERTIDDEVEAPRIAPLWKALVCAAIAAAVALWVSWSAPPWGAAFPWNQSAEVKQLDPASYM